ncbi:MAG: 6-phosphofructokinase [Candidatus Sumerlaeia bacterium]
MAKTNKERNLLVAQSGGPTMVINQSLVGVVEEALKHDGIDRILGGVRGFEGIKENDLVDLRSESLATLERVAQTPGAGLLSCRFKLTRDRCKEIFDVLSRHNVHYFFYIGGNDSALAASILNQIAREHRYELRIFHVPKTVDNDLLVTHHCPGYGSAARYVALAHMGDDMDNRSIKGIKINVCMGRNAGWLTAAAALARQRDDDGPHLIYLPERPLTLKRFVEDVLRVFDRHKRALVAVSEGVCDENGAVLVQSELIRRELAELDMQPVISMLDACAAVEEASGGAKKDSFGHMQLSGTGLLGDFLAAVVKIYAYKHKKIKSLRLRADTLGYPQRSMMGVVSSVDQQEAREVGRRAVQYCMRGDIDGSVAINRLGEEGGPYAVEYFLANLRDVADPERSSKEQIKIVPDTMIAAGGNDVTQEFIDYARPLVGSLPEKGFLSFKKVTEEGATG